MNPSFIKGVNNPCDHKQHNEPLCPGELLIQDTFDIGTLTGIGRVYLYIVTDLFSSFTFGFMHDRKAPEGAVAILHNEVLPFFRERGISPSVIQTGGGAEFGGADRHLYKLYLELNEVTHRRTPERAGTNRRLSIFKRTVANEFFQVLLPENAYGSIEDLQRDFDVWLHSYNYRRPRSDCRSLGKTAFDIIAQFIR